MGNKISRLIQPGKPALLQIIQKGTTPISTIELIIIISKKPGRKNAENMRDPTIKILDYGTSYDTATGNQDFVELGNDDVDSGSNRHSLPCQTMIHATRFRSRRIKHSTHTISFQPRVAD